MGNVLYMFYLSKILDFFDTIFIILGKKWNQLSVLHVYHHLTIFFVSFIAVFSPVVATPMARTTTSLTNSLSVLPHGRFTL